MVYDNVRNDLEADVVKGIYRLPQLCLTAVCTVQIVQVCREVPVAGSRPHMCQRAVWWRDW